MFVFSVHRHSGQVIEEGAKKPKNKTTTTTYKSGGFMKLIYFPYQDYFIVGKIEILAKIYNNLAL